jgi:hypothetical protein
MVVIVGSRLNLQQSQYTLHLFGKVFIELLLDRFIFQARIRTRRTTFFQLNSGQAPRRDK